MLTLDPTTLAEYNAVNLGSQRCQAVLNALQAPVVVRVRDGSGQIMGEGVMDSPWATTQGSTLTIGEVVSFAVLISGTPNEATWTLSFESGSRYLRGSFGLYGSGADFTWRRATADEPMAWEQGQSATLGTVEATAVDIPVNNDPWVTGHQLEAVTANQPFSIILEAVDPENDPLIFSSANLPGDLVLTPLEPIGTTQRVQVSSAEGLAAVPGGYNFSIEANDEPVVPVPDQVTGVVASNVTFYSALLSWSTTNGATSYIVERSMAGGPWVQIRTTANTSITDGSLAATTNYSYRVAGVNSAGAGPWSSTVAITTETNPVAGDAEADWLYRAGLTKDANGDLMLDPNPSNPNADGVVFAHDFRYETEVTHWRQSVGKRALDNSEVLPGAQPDLGPIVNGRFDTASGYTTTLWADGGIPGTQGGTPKCLRTIAPKAYGKTIAGEVFPENSWSRGGDGVSSNTIARPGYSELVGLSPNMCHNFELVAGGGYERLPAPFYSPGNGLPYNDRAANGAVPRFIYEAVHGNGELGYYKNNWRVGRWAHPDYLEQQTGNPFPASRNPENYPYGVIGHEFYWQARARISTGRWGYRDDPRPNGDLDGKIQDLVPYNGGDYYPKPPVERWGKQKTPGGKLFMVNPADPEIAILDSHDDAPYNYQTARPLWYTRQGAGSNIDIGGATSYQYGGPWQATCASNQDRTQPNACWEYPEDEWFTMYCHVICGHSNTPQGWGSNKVYGPADGGAGEWTSNNAVISRYDPNPYASYARVTATGPQPSISLTQDLGYNLYHPTAHGNIRGLALHTDAYTGFSVRAMRVGGSGWSGILRWKTENHGFVVTHQIALPDPGVAIGQWFTLEFDCTANSDWANSELKNFEIILGADVGDVFDIYELILKQDWPDTHIELQVAKWGETEYQTIYRYDYFPFWFSWSNNPYGWNSFAFNCYFNLVPSWVEIRHDLAQLIWSTKPIPCPQVY